MPITINAKNLARRARRVSASDPVLATLFRRQGPPPLWTRKPGLSSLIHIILEQQVSLASARCSFQRVKDCCGGRVSARQICTLGPERLRRRARLTRQKSAYIHEVALASRRRRLILSQLGSCTDDEAIKRMIDVRGIGPWTANIYLLNALARPDVLPPGDLALADELGVVCSLSDRPDDAWIRERASAWRPLRSVAVRMLWHSYLVRKGRHDELAT